MIHFLVFKNILIETEVDYESNYKDYFGFFLMYQIAIYRPMLVIE